MPGHHVKQLVLRAPISTATAEFCRNELSLEQPGLVLLYCTSTAAHGPALWGAFVQADGLAAVGSQGYVRFGNMVQAAAAFFEMTIRGDQLFYPGGRQAHFVWHLYPDLVWGRAAIIGVGYYMANYEDCVDFYFQTPDQMHTAVFQRIVIYGIQSPNHWYRGDRRYVGLCEMPAWLRPKPLQSKL